MLLSGTNYFPAIDLNLILKDRHIVNQIKSKNQINITYFPQAIRSIFIEWVIIKNHNYRAYRFYDDAVLGLVLLP
jgi:hypothetical protein